MLTDVDATMSMNPSQRKPEMSGLQMEVLIDGMSPRDGDSHVTARDAANK